VLIFFFLGSVYHLLTHAFPTRVALPQRYGTRPRPTVFPDAARNPDFAAGPW